MNNKPLVSIIIPAYMEGEYLENSLAKLATHLRTLSNKSFEVIIVVAQGADNTLEIARKSGNLFTNLVVIEAGERKGKGRDVRLGMLKATGKYRIFMDADMATPLHHINEVLEQLENNVKVVIAVRDLVAIHKGFTRKVVTRLANLAAQLLLVPGIKDTQCGFKAFEESAAKEIFSRQTIMGWSFDVEILKIARLLGYKISFVEATDWEDPKKIGLAGDSPIKIVFQEASTLLKIRINAWMGKYKKANFNPLFEE